MRGRMREREGENEGEGRAMQVGQRSAMIKVNRSC